ncbi:G5 domain-containing protein, partial [Thermanaerothrix sp.]|uniref:G5 domain-containing protein n=1 Tax=Thermanaerothrix sp. TaxID=2972675 RepID=UPI003C7A4BC4
MEDNEQRYQTDVPVGTTVQTVLERLNLSLGVLDRTDPPTFTVLNRDSRITIIRVKEVFETEEVVVPFEQQMVRNESLPEGETRLVQPGENGLQQITYRRLLENGKEVARTVFKVETIREPRPE